MLLGLAGVVLVGLEIVPEVGRRSTLRRLAKRKRMVSCDRIDCEAVDVLKCGVCGLCGLALFV